MDFLQVVLCGAGCSLRPLVGLGAGTVRLGGSLRTGGTWEESRGVMGLAKGGRPKIAPGYYTNIYIYVDTYICIYIYIEFFCAIDM